VLLGRFRDQSHRPSPLLGREPYSWYDSISSQIGVPTKAWPFTSAANTLPHAKVRPNTNLSLPEPMQRPPRQ
jgi:hypothetical protein